MKILLVTGKKAEEEVRHYIKARCPELGLYVSPSCDVAALMDVEEIAKQLSGEDLSQYSLILFPGAVKGDVSVVAEAAGIKAVKGPRNLADLDMVLEKLKNKEVKLSAREPADSILKKEIAKEVRKGLEKAYQKPADYSIKLKGKEPVYLGSGIPHIIAEINEAPLLPEKELREKAKQYVKSGAEVIDIGMVPGKDNSSALAGIIKALRSAVDVPLSIDSLSKKEVLAAAEAGIDLIISIDETNSGAIPYLDVPYVLIPRDAKGIVPDKAGDRIKIIEGLMKQAKGKDYIVDLILNPVNYGFTESLKAYLLFKEKYPEVPLFMGAGNVSELIDADSVGVNALIMAVASELSVDLVLSTEASQKTLGSISELRKAAEMMYLSKERKQAPKDLGIDLLVLKEKNRRLYPAKDYGVEKTKVSEGRDVELEDSEFEIFLKDEINVVCYKGKKPVAHLLGDSAEKLYKEIMSRDLVKKPDHAAYLGKELAKAEIALKLGKNYYQDEDLF